ncbi:replicative DNA helicase [Paenibacillus sp. FSL L8-0708]|uniref:replicative DNA helicase n=1 Tax=Paenibacillus sp. FSL L8-0708 TaxID=2975311 RepID=UPI0030F66332
MQNEWARTLEAHEEALGIFLNEPDLFRESLPLLKPDLFLDYEWLYWVMRNVEDREGLTYQGVVRSPECPAERLDLVRMLKETFFNENRLPSLIQEMKRERNKRDLHQIGTELISRLGVMDSDDMLRTVQQKVNELQSSDSGLISNSDTDVEAWYKNVLEIAADPSKAYGMLSGLGPLDKLLTGFHRQHFSVLGGYTSMGKTAIVLEILLRMNAAGIKCAMFSLEMSKRDLYNRTMANLMYVGAEDLRMGRLYPEQYQNMARFKDQLKSLYIDDTRGLTADQICDKIKYLKRRQGLDFVVVDYIQDVGEQGETNDNSGSAIGRICRKLRKASLDNDVHVMGLSQVVRGTASREDKRPKVSDLAGSTGIETSADIIMLAYRDEYYNPDTNYKGMIELDIAKHRNGQIGKVNLKFDKATQKIDVYK